MVIVKIINYNMYNYIIYYNIITVSQKVSSNVESLLNDGENIRNLGKELTIEINNLRQNLESALRACTGQDRPLCTIIDSSGLRVTLRIDQVNSIHFYKLILM